MRQRRRLIGAVALVLLIGLLGAPLLALLTAGLDGREVAAGAYLWDVTRFTLLQAGLSAALSVGLAVPVALALAHRPDLPGRRLLLRLFAMPMALPALVGVTGIVGIYGQAGLLSELAGWFELTRFPSIYGLAGIVLAHVFYNLPLATLLLLARLEATPVETWRIAVALGLGARDILRFIDLPAIREVLPRILSLVFMLAVASFTIVLTLGGGPGATTLEVAIYQALRFDFDPGLAARLAILQVAVSLLVAFAAGRSAVPMLVEAGTGKGRGRPQAGSRWRDGAIIGLAAVFVLGPLAAVVAGGLSRSLPSLLVDPLVMRALATSLVIGIAAACLGLIAAYALALAAAAGPARFYDVVSLVTLVVPSVVIAAGWYLLAHRLGVAGWATAPLVVLLNVLMAIPYAASVLIPAVRALAERQDRLAVSLGLTGWRRFRLIDGPLLKRQMALAFGLAGLVSLGDLGIIAIFGGDGLVTLPLLLYQRLGSYRTGDADALALVLMALTLALAWMLPRSVAGDPTP
ncbi:MAG: ABC transporter permease subunit [Hyphomicrobiaceae bacterium]